MKIKLTKKISNDLIQKLSQLVENEFSDLFLAVVVHGSVATNEIIPYSDFDGLLIVKDQHHGSRNYNKFISKSMKIIYQFDPLQHHGWFVIKESQLKNYPQTYFPIELYEFSSLIYPQKVELDVKIPEIIDFKQPFYDLSASLENKINKNFHAKNDYQLKSFLSEVMMLPTLYLQAKLKQGIYKKDSFVLIKQDLNDVSFFDSISEIRQNWKSSKLSPLKIFILTFVSSKVIKILKKTHIIFPSKNKVANFNIELQEVIKLLKKQLNENN